MINKELEKMINGAIYIWREGIYYDVKICAGRQAYILHESGSYSAAYNFKRRFAKNLVAEINGK